MWKFKKNKFKNCNGCNWSSGACYKLSYNQKGKYFKIKAKNWSCASVLKYVVFKPLEKLKQKRF